METKVAIIGAGISGLTTAVVLAEHGIKPVCFAAAGPQNTTSAVAAAIWYPYKAKPAADVTAWSMISYGRLLELVKQPGAGVTLIELRNYSRSKNIKVPRWAHALGCRELRPDEMLHNYSSGFALTVPLMEAPKYLGFLQNKLTAAGITVEIGKTYGKLVDISSEFGIIVNCAGIGAKALIPRAGVKAYRGQVVSVELHRPWALVCVEDPLTYVFPRSQDCILGGTDTASDNAEPNAGDTDRIMKNCVKALGLAEPPAIRGGAMVGLRPVRGKGVRVEKVELEDGRPVIHNYGHGGSGFTLSWGCAHKVYELLRTLG